MSIQDKIENFTISEINSAYNKSEDDEPILINDLAKNQIRCKITELFATLSYLGYALP